MDFLKSAISNAGGNNNNNNNNDNNNNQGGDNQNNQGGDNNQNNQGGDNNNQNNQDYVDKAFDAVSKKAGYNINPETEEKITDGARGLYEKYSGSKVDPKISN